MGLNQEKKHHENLNHRQRHIRRVEDDNSHQLIKRTNEQSWTNFINQRNRT